MFDGNFKTTRKVSLSGRKKPFSTSSSSLLSSSTSSSYGGVSSVGGSSKEDLLLQSRLAREERLAHRTRTAASTKIQALYRRVSVTRRARAQVFRQLEQELTQLVATHDIRQLPVPTARLDGFLRQFLFATYPRALRAREMTDQRVRLVQDYVVCMLLVSVLKGHDASCNFMAAASSTEPTWLYQMTRILDISMDVAITTAATATPIEQATNPYVLLLDLCTTKERYNSMRDGDYVWGRLLCGLACSVTRCGTFEALRQLILNDVTEQSRVAQLVAGISSKTIESVVLTENGTNPRYRDRMLEVIAQKILLTPVTVRSSLMRQVATSLSRGSSIEVDQEVMLWTAILPSLVQDGLTWAERAIAVGNVLDLITISSTPALVVESGLAVASNLITLSHMEWAFDVVDDEAGNASAQTQMNDIDIDDDDELFQSKSTMQVIPTFVGASEREQARNGLQALHQHAGKVKDQWAHLCDAQFIRRAFSATQGGTMHLVCTIYTKFLLALGRSHLLSVRQALKPPGPAIFAFLSAVSVERTDDRNFKGEVPVVQRLWTLTKSSLGSRSIGFSTVKWIDSRLEPMLLFNVIYSYMLLALDDETFYDRAWPFRQADVVEIVEFLKRFIYETCWTVSSTGGSGQMSIEAMSNQQLLFPTLTTGVKLFNQLYDRDCRRRFSIDGGWLWPAMPTVKETVDLESMEGELYDVQALFKLMNGASSLSQHSKVSLILTTIPQVFSFNDRVLLFEKLLDDEKRNLSGWRDEFSRAIQVRIKRDDIVDNSFEFFHQVSERQSASTLKSRIKVTFINEQGLEEAGIDGGGVFKEYIDSLTKNAFSPEYGFFLATNEQLLYPNPSTRQLVDGSFKDVLDRFRFLGRVLGKAVYENILVEPQFAAFFLNKLLGKFNYIDDLRSLDPDLYRNLMHLKGYQGNVEDLALTFSLTEHEYGQAVTRELVPDGANIAVTNANRIRYIHLLANYKLNVLSSSESNAFLRGFRDLIPAKWIQMFSPSELQTLIGGTANKIDVADWQRHTVYGGGYHPSQRIVQWFWEVVEHEFTAEERSLLLKFITSCSRQPLLGFGQLAPQICIHQVRIEDDDRLPSSATCMNLLKLPTYSTKQILREKLLYAIKSNAGFDLS